jgi:hypothetical protein
MTTRFRDVDKRDLDHQIARVAWALLFITLGGLGLLESVPHGTWLIAAGLILVGAQAACVLNQIPIRSFSLVLGLAAIGFGLAAFVGTDVPVLPIILVLIGVSMLLPARLGGERASGVAGASRRGLPS